MPIHSTYAGIFSIDPAESISAGIYVISTPDNQPFYVGKSTSSMHHRLGRHLINVFDPKKTRKEYASIKLRDAGESKWDYLVSLYSQEDVSALTGSDICSIGCAEAVMLLAVGTTIANRTQPKLCRQCRGTFHGITPTVRKKLRQMEKGED